MSRAPLNLIVLIAVIGLYAGADAAQTAAPDEPSHGALNFFFEEISHVLVGAVAAVAGVLAHRAWSRRRWRPAPAGAVIETVLVVDLVDSTQLATRHGDSLAMRAARAMAQR